MTEGAGANGKHNLYPGKTLDFPESPHSPFNNDIISTSRSRQKLLDSAVCLDKTRLNSACLKPALAQALTDSFLRVA